MKQLENNNGGNALPCGTPLLLLPATHAVRKHATFPAIMARNATADKSRFRSGAI